MLIYKATNIITGKCYIGRTVGSMRRRMQRHFSYAKTGEKGYFYNALRKYDKKSFSWTILQDNIDTYELMNFNEIYYIAKFKSFGPGGYNMTRGGDGALGTKHSQRTKDKIGKAHLGMKRSEETKRRISEKARGRKRSEETKLKMSRAFKGIERSAEAKARMSKAQQNIPTEQRKEIALKISRANSGKVRTETVKKQISESVKSLKKITCPHCDSAFSPGNYGYWHGDNCKEYKK